MCVLNGQVLVEERTIANLLCEELHCVENEGARAADLDNVLHIL